MVIAVVVCILRIRLANDYMTHRKALLFIVIIWNGLEGRNQIKL